MGQKSNPIGLRLGINRSWDSVWFDEKSFSEKVHEDIIIRKFIFNKYKTASISRINNIEDSETTNLKQGALYGSLILAGICYFWAAKEFLVSKLVLVSNILLSGQQYSLVSKILLLVEQNLYRGGATLRPP